MHGVKNSVQLIGMVDNSPAITITESGKKCAVLTIYTDELFRDSKGEKVVERQSHHLVGWGKVAELCEVNVRKGTEILISGALIGRSVIETDTQKSLLPQVLIKELLILSGNPVV